jgi:hypothetical protein
MAKNRSLKKRSQRKMKGGKWDENGKWVPDEVPDDWSQYLPPPLYSKDMGFTPEEYKSLSSPQEEEKQMFFPPPPPPPPQTPGSLVFDSSMLLNPDLLKTVVNDLDEVNKEIKFGDITLICKAKFTITDPGYDGALRIVCGKINDSSLLFVATADEKTSGQQLDDKDNELSYLWPGTAVVQWSIESFENPSIGNAAISAASIEATKVVAHYFRKPMFNPVTGELTFGTEMSEIPDGVATYIKGLVTEAQNANTDDVQTGGLPFTQTLLALLGVGTAAAASNASPEFANIGIGPTQVANTGKNSTDVSVLPTTQDLSSLYKNYPGAVGVSLPDIRVAGLLPEQSSLNVTPKSLDTLAPLPELSIINVPGKLWRWASPPERATIQKFSNNLQKVTYEAMTKYGIPGENLQQVYDNAVQACIAKVTPETVSISIIDPDTCSSLLQEGKKEAELKQSTKNSDNTEAISGIFLKKNNPSSNLRANAPAAALGEKEGLGERMKRDQTLFWGDAKHREGSSELEVLKKLQEFAKDPTLKAYNDNLPFIKAALGNDPNALKEYAAIVGRESDEAREVGGYDLLLKIQEDLGPLVRVYDGSTVGKAIQESPVMLENEIAAAAAGIQKNILEFAEKTGLTSKEVSKNGAVRYFDNKHVNSEKAVNARKALRLEGVYEEANADFENEMWMQNLFRNTIEGLASLAGLGLLLEIRKHINEIGETEKFETGKIELKKLNMKLLKTQKVLDNLKINTWEVIKTKNLNKYAEQIELDHFKDAWNDMIDKKELPLIFDEKNEPKTIAIDEAVRLIQIRMKKMGWFTQNVGASLGIKGSRYGLKFFDNKKKVEFGTGKGKGKGIGGSRRRLLSGKRRATKGVKKANVNRTKKHPRQKKRHTNTRRKRS